MRAKNAISLHFRLSIAVFIISLSVPIMTPITSFADLSRLDEVEQLFHEGRYQDLYERYLADIPAFNRFSRSTEQLYYFFALTCIELGYYDEAEGYLYTIRTKTDFPAYLETYDLIWAKLLDRRGFVFAAYRKYLFIRALYPHTMAMPAVLLRLGQLAQILGKFEPARRHYMTLLEKFPYSPEAQFLSENDDFKLTGFTLVFGAFKEEENAKRCVSLLSAKDVSTFISRSFYKNQRAFLVCFGSYQDKTLATQARSEFRKNGFGVVIYPSFPQEAGLDYFESPEASEIPEEDRLLRNSLADGETLSFNYSDDGKPKAEVSNDIGALPPPKVQTGKQEFTFGITRRVKF